MRRAAKVDGNQPIVVSAFRAAGFSVLLLHAVGRGCPDICVAKRGRTALIEIKDDAQPLSQRKLTPKEEEFHERWQGQLFIVENVEQVFRIAHDW